MKAPSADSFQTFSLLKTGSRELGYWSLARLAAATGRDPARLPVSLRVLLENLLRTDDGSPLARRSIEAVLDWNPKAVPDTEIAFTPARVLLQDFTGVPCVVDLAAMRDAMALMGGDPSKINPLQPVDLVIDHSVQVDHFASSDALALNAALDYSRNRERYNFLRWGQNAFANFRVVPPSTGIVHQVNLEYLAPVVFVREQDGQSWVYPDTLVGTDSHTPMVNGLGVVGWGVGGIEAEAAMLGQPISMLLPQVVGVRLTGRLTAGATATDLVLTITEMLRKFGVVGKFVEYFGDGLSSLSVADRATIANMAPEYGATIGFFPVDAQTLDYLRLTGRTEDQISLVETYCRVQGLFREPGAPEPEFSDVLELDLGSVVASLAGPRRPQDRIPLTQAKPAFRAALVEFLEASGRKIPLLAREKWLAADDAEAENSLDDSNPLYRRILVRRNGESFPLTHGDVVIAAITSCTNTSNPALLVAAGLVAKKARERGLRVRPWVKTSFAPGSQVVTRYLAEAGLMKPLEELGFHIVGFGCTTCIGNSGPLPEPISQAIAQADLVATAVLSGNRNFEGRINAQVKANYLASPPLVVAYALAGTMNKDILHEPIGWDASGKPVVLADIWPTPDEVAAVVDGFVRSEQYREAYSSVFEGDAEWKALPTPKGDMFAWDPASTYIKSPPFFENLARDPAPPADITGARVLAVLGHSVTTDHISPAGSIAKNSPAARYLIERGVEPKDFNSYGARRGNHEVMMRGTFANIRLRNLLAPGTEGGVTVHLPDGKQMSIFDAAMKYRDEGVPLIVIAGREYGSGSSRDWAAKGPALLGVRAVIAESYERIHRSNLVGMGILPCEFLPGETRETIGLTGREVFEFLGIADGMEPGKRLTVRAHDETGGVKEFSVKARIDTPNEVAYYRHGGILPYVLRQLLAS
ncbi:MAG: aconitate hydratase AcnA [Candidatus Sumerlaeaceae bacterium]|nr:aconitate hydratase AcnA [Candidatus Sumerlaeaceae bacterium]